MPNLYVARHGETVANVPGEERLRGWGDWPLTDTGKRQAQELGAQLKALGVKRVVTDDLVRTRWTADYVSHAIGSEPIHDPGFRPWNIGTFEGQLELTHKPLLMSYIQSPHLAIPNGEAYDTFFKRWRDALWHYYSRAKETGHHWAAIIHSGQFATLDDVVLGRGSTPTADYEPTPGQILTIDVSESPAHVEVL